MPVEHVTSLDDARLTEYRDVPDPERLRLGDVFVAEGRLVVRTLLGRSSMAARSVLLTTRAFDSLADVLVPRLDTLTVFVVDAGTIEALTGFNIHRGCLAIGVRPAPRPLDSLAARLPGFRRVVVAEGLANADNMGGIFRNAAAFGADLVVLGPGCCDPLYRKAIRVSMGAALHVPFCQATDWPRSLDVLRGAGFAVAALTTAASARPITGWSARVTAADRVALMVGSEGEGLSEAALAASDVAVRIPMAAGHDSLNVSTAAGIALHSVFR